LGLPFERPPEAVCLLRLSALGDVCHAIPLLRTLQAAWPRAHFSWVVGAQEARLASLVEGVEVIPFDKRGGLPALRALRARLRGRRFDLLLQLQVALRASLVSLAVRADVKLGFDRARAREGQWLFTNARIAPRQREHVVDSLFGFAEACGVRERVIRFDVALPPEARAYAERLVPDRRATLVLSPCSSEPTRNWLPERYAEVADYAAVRHGMRVILCGGRSAPERAMAAAIERRARTPLLNQIGKDTLPELIALLARARVLVCPDSGPAHLATLTGTPVIGLHATSNPERSGAYASRHWCVNRFADAARRYRGKSVEEMPWHERIEEPGVMELIQVADVTDKLDALLGSAP
jgi:heptosyltransferase I